MDTDFFYCSESFQKKKPLRVKNYKVGGGFAACYTDEQEHFIKVNTQNEPVPFIEVSSYFIQLLNNRTGALVKCSAGRRWKQQTKF